MGDRLDEVLFGEADFGFASNNCNNLQENNVASLCENNKSNQQQYKSCIIINNDNCNESNNNNYTNQQQISCFNSRKNGNNLNNNGCETVNELLQSKSLTLSISKGGVNKTREDLQEMIDQIPYPHDGDLSLTSLSNNSASTTPQKIIQMQNNQHQGKETGKILHEQNYVSPEDLKFSGPNTMDSHGYQDQQMLLLNHLHQQQQQQQQQLQSSNANNSAITITNCCDLSNTFTGLGGNHKQQPQQQMYTNYQQHQSSMLMQSQYSNGIRFNTTNSNYISALDSDKFRTSCNSNINEIEDPANLFPNAEHMDDLTVSQASCLDSATPQYSSIMNWNKQHVTPAESKNLFPAVVAPSIEFSHENTSSLNFALQSINQNSNKLSNGQSCTSSSNKGLAMMMSAQTTTLPSSGKDREWQGRKSDDEGEQQQQLENVDNEEEYDHQNNDYNINCNTSNNIDYSQQFGNEEVLFGTQSLNKFQLSNNYSNSFNSPNNFKGQNSLANNNNYNVGQKQQQQQQPQIKASTKQQILQQNLEDLQQSCARQQLQTQPSQSTQPQQQLYTQQQQRCQTLQSPYSPSSGLDNGQNHQGRSRKQKHQLSSKEQSQMRIKTEIIVKRNQDLEKELHMKGKIMKKLEQENSFLGQRIIELEEKAQFLQEKYKDASSIEQLRGKTLEGTKNQLKQLKMAGEKKDVKIQELSAQVQELQSRESMMEAAIDKELSQLMAKMESEQVILRSYHKRVEDMQLEINEQKRINETDLAENAKRVTHLTKQIEQLISERNELIQERNNEAGSIQQYEELTQTMNNKIREYEQREVESQSLIKELKTKLEVFLVAQQQQQSTFHDGLSGYNTNSTNCNIISGGMNNSETRTHMYEEEISRQKVNYERQIAKLKEQISELKSSYKQASQPNSNYASNNNDSRIINVEYLNGTGNFNATNASFGGVYDQMSRTLGGGGGIANSNGVIGENNMLMSNSQASGMLKQNLKDISSILLETAVQNTEESKDQQQQIQVGTVQVSMDELHILQQSKQGLAEYQKKLAHVSEEKEEKEKVLKDVQKQLICAHSDLKALKNENELLEVQLRNVEASENQHRKREQELMQECNGLRQELHMTFTTNSNGRKEQSSSDNNNEQQQQQKRKLQLEEEVSKLKASLKEQEQLLKQDLRKLEEEKTILEQTVQLHMEISAKNELDAKQMRCKVQTLTQDNEFLQAQLQLQDRSDRNYVDEMTRSWQERIASTEKRMDSLSKEINDKNQEIINLNIALREEQSSHERKQREMQELLTEQEHLAEQRQEQSKLQQQQQQQQTKEEDNNKNNNSQIVKLKLSLKEKEIGLQKLEETVSQVNEEACSLRKKLKQIESDAAKMKEESTTKIKKLEEEVQSLKNQADALKERTTLLNKEKQLILEAKELCDSRLSENCKDLEKMQIQLKEKQQEVKQLQEISNRLESREEATSKEAGKTTDKLQQTIKKLEKNLKQLQEEKDALNCQLRAGQSQSTSTSSKSSTAIGTLKQPQEKEGSSLDEQKSKQKESLIKLLEEKNERLSAQVKEKDKKNIDLFNQNKTLSDQLKKMEDSCKQVREEQEKIKKLLSQKTSDLKVANTGLKEMRDKNTELLIQVGQLQSKIENLEKELMNNTGSGNCNNSSSMGNNNNNDECLSTTVSSNINILQQQQSCGSSHQVKSNVGQNHQPFEENPQNLKKLCNELINNNQEFAKMKEIFQQKISDMQERIRNLEQECELFKEENFTLNSENSTLQIQVKSLSEKVILYEMSLKIKPLNDFECSQQQLQQHLVVEPVECPADAYNRSNSFGGGNGGFLLTKQLEQQLQSQQQQQPQNQQQLQLLADNSCYECPEAKSAQKSTGCQPFNTLKLDFGSSLSTKGCRNVLETLDAELHNDFMNSDFSAAENPLNVQISKFQQMTQQQQQQLIQNSQKSLQPYQTNVFQHNLGEVVDFSPEMLSTEDTVHLMNEILRRVAKSQQMTNMMVRSEEFQNLIYAIKENHDFSNLPEDFTRSDLKEKKSLRSQSMATGCSSAKQQIITSTNESQKFRKINMSGQY